MRVLYFPALFVLFCGLSACAAEPALDLSRIDRKVLREPNYTSQPHYSLLVFGPKAEHRAWLVVDGTDVAYLDRNGNGDLTEPEDRIPLDVKATDELKVGNPGVVKKMHIFSLGKVAGAELIFQLWIRNPEFNAAGDTVAQTFKKWDENNWLNGTLYRVTADRSQAQNPLLLTATAAEAQITHFDGPLTMELKWGDRQKLEPWPKPTVFDIHIGSRNLLATNCDERGFGFTRLAVTEIPPHIHPIATFEFPATTPGATPLVKRQVLDQRCCGDTFYAQFTMPRDAERGEIKVTVECPAWSEHVVLSVKFNVPINQGISELAEYSYIMFHDPAIHIEDAVDTLRKRGLDVSILPERLTVIANDRPTFGIKLVRDESTLETSAALAEGRKDESRLSRCDARFEIGFSEADKILQEPKTLREIQSALQELTRGYLYNTWDKRISAPK